jgi:serine phosphatase RsbU (regulator of sigma subunit)
MLHKSITLSIPLNAKPKIMRAYQDLANIYKELQQPWQALESYEKYMEFKAEVMGEETSLQLRNAAAIHAVEEARKESEIEKLRNVELKKAYEQIASQNQHIVDSIKYAKRIQEAILDPIDTITQNLGDAFIFYQAKDIVSGDFYWYGEVEPEEEPNKIYKIMIVADCTGHGVPGAFMTVMGNDFLNDIIISQQIISPSAILHKLDDKVTMTLQKQGRENTRTNDGMDISILVIDETEQKAYFAAAKHPLYWVSNGEIHEIKGSKFPIGSNQYKTIKEFETHSYPIRKGDTFYLSSDGYQDQFGEGNKGKFMKRKFREFLLAISNLPMSQQHDALQKMIVEWKGNRTQTDDWLVMGIKF